MAKGRRAMRNRITIQSAVITTGNYGQQVESSWSNVTGLVSIPADFVVTGGGEMFRGSQVQADVVGVFTIRGQPISILTQHRVVHVDDSNKAYGISSVRPAAGPFESADRDLLIFVKAIADGS